MSVVSLSFQVVPWLSRAILYSIRLFYNIENFNYQNALFPVMARCVVMAQRYDAGITTKRSFQCRLTPNLGLNLKMSDSLQGETLQDRMDRVQELTEFTEKCKKRLEDIFERLGWSWDCEDANKVS